MDNQNDTPKKQSKKQTSNGPKSGRKNFANTEAMNEARRRNLQLAREVRKNKPPRLHARSLTAKQYAERQMAMRVCQYQPDPEAAFLYWDARKEIDAMFRAVRKAEREAKRREQLEAKNAKRAAK